MKLIEPGFFKRNKKLILIAVSLMLISIILSAIYSFFTAGASYGEITRGLMQPGGSAKIANMQFSGMGIFLNNLYANILILLGGFVFSIFSVISIILNGITIGSPFGYDFNFACVAILPHAILEYFATSLSLVIALKITNRCY